MCERAKRAEVALLEHKLETGLTVLERAHKDAGQRVKDLETELKKCGLIVLCYIRKIGKLRFCIGKCRACLIASRARNGTAAEELKGAVAEWKAKREEVANLIATSKTEFAAQVSYFSLSTVVDSKSYIVIPYLLISSLTK